MSGPGYQIVRAHDVHQPVYASDDFESYAATTHLDSGYDFAQGSATWGDWTSCNVQDTLPHNGTKSLYFHWGPDADLADSTSEQRFSLWDNLTSMWWEYWVHFPSNYYHRDQTSGATNNKFFRLYGDSYSLYDNKIGGTLEPVTEEWLYWNPEWEGLTAIGDSYFYFKYVYAGEHSAGSHLSPAGYPLVTDATRNTWTRIRMYMYLGTGTITGGGGPNYYGDGAFKLWVNDSLAYDFSDPGFYMTPVSGHEYWNLGYLFGWSNSGFASLTDVYVDDLKFYAANPGW